VLNFVTFFLSPLVGHLADRTKRVYLLRIGSMASHLGSVWLGFASGVPSLLAARAVTGIGRSIQDPALYPLLSDYYPVDRRGRVISFVLQYAGLGGILAPLMIGTIATLYGWRAAFIVFGGVAAVVSLGYFVLREPVRGMQDKLAAGATENEASHPEPSIPLG